jgi:transposase InsO family protein
LKAGGGKEWFTAAELAELALPGLPTTKRKMNERASADMWAMRVGNNGEPLARASGRRGGGLEYHWSVVPAAARAALAARAIEAVADVSAQPETRAAAKWRHFERQTAKAKAEAHRRATAIAMIENYVDIGGLTKSAAVANTAARMKIGAATLWNWLKLVEGVAAADRLAYLAPGHAGGGAEVEIDPDALKILLSDYLRPEQPTFSSCYYRLLKGYAEPKGIKLPCERTLRRRLDKQLDRRVVTARREGAEALRRSLPSQRRTVEALQAMELVNIDGHKWDVFVQWPDGTIARPLMVAIQDIYSRKMLAWSIGRTESAVETRLAFAQLFEKYGIPAACLLDNGRAFASKWITGGAASRFRFKIREEEPLGVLTALGVKIHWATPYRGQSKPIERCFRDFCDSIARHPALAGAYTGNGVDAKPENYGSKAIPIEQFREVVEAGIAAHNARTGRRTEMGAGVRSFDQVFAESYAVAPIGKATPEQLRLALLAADDRPTDKRTGVITLHGNQYWAEELSQIAGDRVTIRFNPDDLHAPIHVYTRDGRYLCAAPAFQSTGFIDVEAAKDRARMEKRHKTAVREMIEAEQLLSAAQVADMLQRTANEPLNAPGVIRPVRHRGQTAAALKPLTQAVPIAREEAAQDARIDRMAGGMRRLRPVE